MAIRLLAEQRAHRKRRRPARLVVRRLHVAEVLGQRFAFSPYFDKKRCSLRMQKQQQPAAMPTAEFKTKARPLHVHVTHTPPSINAHSSSEEAKAGAEDVVASVTEGEENLGEPTAPSAPTDVGMISSLTLLPSEFSTGSYGWKGSKKVWVELQGAEGTVEKVQVMLT